MAEVMKKNLLEKYKEELGRNMDDFIRESKHLRGEYHAMVNRTAQVDRVVHKISRTLFEYEIVMGEIKKNLQFQNIRRVYRLVNLQMPSELEEHLEATGCVLWEHFTKTSVNKYDVKAILSQNLGSFETGLAVLPPVSTLMTEVQDEEDPSIFKNQLDLKPLYIAIEQQ